MTELVFECKSITPIYMTGASQNLELRAPSIKGLMRFWWRALQGEENIKTLREKETKIFGGTGEEGGRSSFSIRLNNIHNIDTQNYRPLPHHQGGENCTHCKMINSTNDRCRKGFSPPAMMEHNFIVILTCRCMPEFFSIDQLKSLFMLTSILGGIGKRSRRGFGSFMITKTNNTSNPEDISINYILNLLNIIAPGKYSISKSSIIANNTVKKYPVINEIAIGKHYSTYDSLLKTIGRESSNNNCDYLGYVRENKQRFASPIYVSIILSVDVYRPIITTLSYDPVACKIYKQNNNQNKFKSNIL